MNRTQAEELSYAQSDDRKENRQIEDTERRLSLTRQHVSLIDDVFCEIGAGGPNYRAVGWIGTVALMMKTQIGLGVLSIPAVFHTLGMIPGIICLVVIGIITTWSNHMVGQFKLRHPHVYGVDDAGQLMFGRIGREILAVSFVLYLIFVAGSAMLSLSISLNAVSVHGACTAIFVAVVAIAGFFISSIQTLGKISWLAWIGLICIVAAVLTVTIAVGVEDRPADVPQDRIFVSDYKLTNSPSFTDAISACSSLVFAYAGTPSFFPIVSEMSDPRHYTRSLIICQSGVTITYLTVGIVVYYYAGSYVATPALGTAGVLLKKVAYGIAIPGLLASTFLNIHLASKYIFVRLLRGSRHLSENTFRHWFTWVGCTSGSAVVAYVIASGVPVFGGLVSLIGALFGTLLSFQPYGCMWLYDNWHKFKTERTAALTFMMCWSVFVVLSGMFLTIGGTYGSVVGIIDSYKASGGSSAWSCADNSNSI